MTVYNNSDIKLFNVGKRVGERSDAASRIDIITYIFLYCRRCPYIVYAYYCDL